MTLPDAEQHDLHGRWPSIGAKLPSMLWVVIVLLRQRDDQLKIGWKGLSNHWLPTKGRGPNACVKGFDNQAMSLEIGMGS